MADQLDSATQWSGEDPTWQVAVQQVRKFMPVPTHVWQLFKNAWLGQSDPTTFIRTMGFSKLNPACLFAAAELDTEDKEQDVELLRMAINHLGVRYCSVVLGINLACRTLLKLKPPAHWRVLLQEIITNVEIGVKVGSRTPQIGMEGGALMGFACNAGELLLLAGMPKQYRSWRANRARDARTDARVAVETFGCEPYQITALMLQQLGFGTEVAIGAGAGKGPMDLPVLAFTPEIKRWKAALMWIDALRRGRNYPGDIEVRDFFPALMPTKEGQAAKNVVLDVVYTEIAKVKDKGSEWLWHLPRPGYDQTAKEYALE